MSKVTEIREICGDYALDIEYSKDYTFTMFFNSRRNAETVKRCIEVDDSVPNVATAVDFVEVVRCKDCEHWDEYCFQNEDERLFHEKLWGFPITQMSCGRGECLCKQWEGNKIHETGKDDYCSYGERREENEG